MTGEFGIALQALLFLRNTDEPVSSDRLSDVIAVNPARVRKVMSRLKTHGLVGAKEGASGGYYMVKDPAAITLDIIADALGAEFIVPRSKSGEDARDMENVMAMLYSQLNRSCRERLKGYTVADMGEIPSTVKQDEAM